MAGHIRPLSVAYRGREAGLADLEAPLPLAELAVGDGPWEVELGFGRGSYLVRRAKGGRGRFVGVEISSEYYGILRRKARSHGLDNLVVIRGDARYVMSAALLPAGFARAVHVYHPDPWPKARHQKRRFLDAGSIDLVLRLLEPGGSLFFGTDHPDLAVAVGAIVDSHPALAVRHLAGVWEGGPRTNYEKKYIEEGRPIARLEARLRPGRELLHPAGRADALAGVDGPER